MTSTNVYPQTDPGKDQLPPASTEPCREEAALIARVRAGDERACETLVRQHGGAMLAVARRYLGCEEDSADAVQDSFLSAFQALDTFAGNSQLGTWLYRIVVNRCLMKLRQRKRRRTVSIHDLLPTFDETGHHSRQVTAWGRRPEEVLSRAEIREQVRAGIDCLPEPYREVLLLRDIEEFDTDQTAALLGISRASVKTRLHRARQALRTLLAPVFAPA